MADHTRNSEPEPSDSLKGFGEVVKGFREHAGMSREELAPKVCCSKHTIASIEVGRRFPPHRFAEKADEALGAFGIIVRAAKHLSRNPGLAAWFQMWAQLEGEAITLYAYECRLVPGLLQCESYARAVFESNLPPLSDEQIDRQLTARMDRHKLLTDKPNVTFVFIIEEALLERWTGGREVTREQADHLIRCAQLRNVEVQIMPTRQYHHAGLHGPMYLAETPENRWFAYYEGQRGSQLISAANDVSVLLQRYGKMRSQAHSPEQSLILLERMRGTL